MKKVIGVIALAGTLILPLTGCQNFVQNEPVTCKVTDKDRSTGPEGQSVYRIYTEGCGEDNEVLSLADNWAAGNFNTASTYNKITPGKTYIFDTVGTRNGLLSWFKEITHVQETNIPFP